MSKYHHCYLPLLPVSLPLCQAVCYAQRLGGPERGEGLSKVTGRGVRLTTLQSMCFFQNTPTGWRLLVVGSLQLVWQRGSGFLQITSPSWPMSEGLMRGWGCGETAWENVPAPCKFLQIKAVQVVIDTEYTYCIQGALLSALCTLAPV